MPLIGVGKIDVGSGVGGGIGVLVAVGVGVGVSVGVGVKVGQGVLVGPGVGVCHSSSSAACSSDTACGVQVTGTVASAVGVSVEAAGAVVGSEIGVAAVSPTSGSAWQPSKPNARPISKRKGKFCAIAPKRKASRTLVRLAENKFRLRRRGWDSNPR